MSISMQQHHSALAVPGTCDQTGNDSPQFKWSDFPEGRVAKLVVRFCALAIRYNEHSFYTDILMAEEQEFPPQALLYEKFVLVLPWFGGHSDGYRRSKAIAKVSDSPILPFSARHVSNNLLHFFVKNDRQGNRCYGITNQHPLSAEQGNKLRVVATNYGALLEERVRLGKIITLEEAILWGALPGDKDPIKESEDVLHQFQADP